MLVNASGVPLVGYVAPCPQPEQEATLRRQLQELDELLDVRWFPRVVFSARHKTVEGRYALVCRWPQADKRWELVNGNHADAIDILGWFCEDVQDADSLPVGVDQITNKVLDILHRCDNTRFPWKDRMKKVVERNAKVRRDRKNEILDQTHDEASYLFAKVKGNPIVAVQQDLGD